MIKDIIPLREKIAEETSTHSPELNVIRTLVLNHNDGAESLQEEESQLRTATNAQNSARSEVGLLSLKA